LGFSPVELSIELELRARAEMLSATELLSMPRLTWTHKRRSNERLCDGCHNSITAREINGETVWVHRKGAVEDCGAPIMIPGSRGSMSYLVKPTGDGETHAWSLAHGAGRKWARSETRLRMRERFGVMELVRTPLGGRVICEERDLLYEEAPAAYKNIETVIGDLADAGLISVIATFRPLLTYKTRKLKR
jgi:release factor H-coupled RctB family protein